LNDIPFDPTEQRIERHGVSWCVYEFALQLHAIQFWDRFDGKWLRHNEFMFPDRPNDLPKLRDRLISISSEGDRLIGRGS
jgi:hypothetical protein